MISCELNKKNILTGWKKVVISLKVVKNDKLDMFHWNRCKRNLDAAAATEINPYMSAFSGDTKIKLRNINFCH